MNKIFSEHKDLLLWSGGVDSTAILLDMLDNGINPDLISVTTVNIEDKKNESEKKARKNIKYFIENRYNVELNLKEINNTIEFKGDYNNFTQIIIWLFASLFNLKNTYKTVNLGILENEFRSNGKILYDNIFDNAFKLISSSDQIDIIPKLTFPLEWYTKIDVIENFYNVNEFTRKLFHYTSSCQNPNPDLTPCLKCHSCKLRKGLSKLLIKRSL